MPLTDTLDRAWYPRHGDAWDGQLFRNTILNHIRSHHMVLDVGAGRGIATYMNMRGRAQRICGVDPTPEVLDNPFLDEAKVNDGRTLDYADGTFDLVYANNVAEHLEDPTAFIAEIARVLKPGGVLLIKTPGKFHYMPLIASLTPFAFHRYYNRLRGRSEIDTFPTFYRLNSRSACRREAAKAGLGLEHVEMIEGRPEYLRITPVTYLAGFLYERTVNGLGLDLLKCVLIATFRKPA